MKKKLNSQSSYGKFNSVSLISNDIFDCDFLKDYIIDKSQILGKGSSGKVFTATSKLDQKEFAIKIFYSENLSRFDQEKQTKEIYLNFSLKHSHIVETIDYSADSKKKNFIIVMEKATKSLKNYLEEKKSGLEKEYLLQMILDVLTGLQYAHEKKKISHLDIKPGNILIFMDIDRDEKPGAQTLFVKKKSHIFKLADWGEGKLVGGKMDRTRNFNTHIGGTPQYIAPEILSNLDKEEKKANLAKADIYSFGLCILACCGGDPKGFLSLNYFREKEHHSEYLQNLFKKHSIKEKYGDQILNIIQKMVQFRKKDRITISEIFKLLEDIIQKNKSHFIKKIESKNDIDNKSSISNISNSVIEQPREQIKNKKISDCKLCDKQHATYTNFPNCQHIFGQKCLSKFYQKKFEDYNYYIPKCPFQECKMMLELDRIEDIFGEELYKKYYSKCRLCDLITFQKVLIKMENCHHKFCYKCLDNMLQKDEDKCPLEKCEKKLGTGINRKCQEIKENCLECGLKFEIEVEIVKLKCCKARFCKKCIMILIKDQIKFFSEERKSKVFCMICRANLRNYLVEEIIGNHHFSKYMKKFQRKSKCKICQKYRTFENFEDLKCNHKICSKCLNEYIDAEFQNKNSKNMMCPYAKCEEKIPRELVKKYIIETNNKSEKVVEKKKKIC